MRINLIHKIMFHPKQKDLIKLQGNLSDAILMAPKCQCTGNCKVTKDSQLSLKVGSINSIFYFLHKAAEPFNCLEQDNLA